MKAILLSIFLLSPAIAGKTDAQKLMDDCQAALEGKPQMAWSVIRVRAILEMGIKVPLLISLSLNPEVELYFSKK